MTKPPKAPKIQHATGAGATMNPDDIKFHRFIVAGVIVSLFAAIITSWSGLTAVAVWQLLPVFLLWVTPVMIDVPLVVLTFARGALEKRQVQANWVLGAILSLTTFSSAANAIHTAAETGFDSLQDVWGTITNALAPWLIFLMTEVLWVVATRQKRRVDEQARAKAAAAARKADAARKRREARSTKPATPLAPQETTLDFVLESAATDELGVL